VRTPRALFAALAEEPSLFVELVKFVYRGKGEARRQLDEADTKQAHHAWWVLSEWRELPGLREDGTIDAEALTTWVRHARLALADADRADIGDEQIGQTLASGPPGADGLWPAEPVRGIIESIGSTSLEAGVELGALNDRGVTSRGVYDGGGQERALAATYGQAAREMATTWPRTARILRRLSVSYEHHAQREDDEANVRADMH
jgi:hypothetical protein